MWWNTLMAQWNVYTAAKESVEEGLLKEGKSKAEAQAEAKRIALKTVNVTGDKPSLLERVQFWSPIIVLGYVVYKIVKR